MYRRPPKPPPEPASPFFEPSIHDDSLKTYCTEGTPYETPYNFSTANSMTDLREPAIKEIEREGSSGPSSAEVRAVMKDLITIAKILIIVPVEQCWLLNCFGYNLVMDLSAT